MVLSTLTIGAALASPTNSSALDSAESQRTIQSNTQNSTQKSIQKNLQSGQAEQQLDTMLRENKGKVIYLDFWASWCVPCRKSFPWMNKVQADYANQSFTVISVNVDKDFDLAQRFLAEMPASFPVIYDPNGELASKYKLQGMPSSFLINRDGKFVRAHKGFFSKKIATYETEIEQLLGDQNR
ncbi:hypothetical protein GCM10027050_15110 [Psychrosphaera aestuarii]